MGFDTKTYWLTDRQSQCDFDFDFAVSLEVEYEKEAEYDRTWKKWLGSESAASRERHRATQKSWVCELL
jgi:predicted 3-demethylubiquinone-9 3-methyltransferase (glyoxalase superfamily)